MERNDFERKNKYRPARCCLNCGNSRENGLLRSVACTMMELVMRPSLSIVSVNFVCRLWTEERSDLW
jgi:hypothetical protein